MRKTETLNLRVSAEFKRKLAEQARREKRSMTNYLEATLEKLWQERESARTKPKKGKEAQDRMS